MSTRMSRRWFVAAASGVAGMASAVVLWRGRRHVADGPTTTATESLAYVDHDGWMITPADKERLEQSASAVKHGR